MTARLSLPKTEYYAWGSQQRWLLLSYRDDFQLAAVVVWRIGLVGLWPNEKGCWHNDTTR